MAEHSTIAISRPAVDIIEDVMAFFPTYPPLNHDRPRIRVTVEDGVVIAIGYVKTGQSRKFFEREAAKIEGVKAVDTSALYDDETIWLDTGEATPFGVFTRVSYGVVILSGKLPENTTEEKIAAKISKIPGVRKVIPNFN